MRMDRRRLRRFESKAERSRRFKIVLGGFVSFNFLGEVSTIHWRYCS